MSGTLTGVARELILTGLAGGDNKALGERLMQIERRLAALEGLARDVNETACHIGSVTGVLLQLANSGIGVLRFDFTGLGSSESALRQHRLLRQRRGY